jgi:hypothetical protein
MGDICVMYRSDDEKSDVDEWVKNTLSLLRTA